jgi:hypothetical protein
VAGAVLWLAMLNYLVGTRSVGAVAVATTVLKITALAIVAVARCSRSTPARWP